MVSVTDEERVRERLALLQRTRDRLQVFQALPVGTLTEDQEAIVERLIQVAAQICIDLAGHVIASNGWRMPQDYGDAFTVLREHGVVHPELAGRLQRLAGLRNVLVHLYAEVDDDELHRNLQRGLGDLDEFAKAIARLLT